MFGRESGSGSIPVPSSKNNMNYVQCGNLQDLIDFLEFARTISIYAEDSELYDSELDFITQMRP